ncbi:MAG TPA: thioredoxin [Longimicrobium sp.]|nr:thioredoxin [Longimicrobium sp.]
MSNAVAVTDQTFAAEVEQHPGLTLVDFWAAWCGPCRIIVPFVEEIAAERAGTLKVAKVDSDENPRVSARFNVRSLPTLLFFKDGQVVDQIVGAVPKARIDEVVARHA